MTYEWKNFELFDPALAPWIAENIPEIPAAALVQSETRPRCDRYDTGFILNLRGVNLNEGQSIEDMVSLRLWATEKLVVSVRVRRVFALEAVEVANPKSPGEFLSALVRELTDRIEREILALSDLTDELEDSLPDGRKIADHQLSDIRSRAIKLRRYIAPQRDALTKLASVETKALRQQDQLAIREDANRTMLSLEALDAVKDRVSTLFGQLEARASQQQTWHGYLLSLVAAIFLPLGFLTGVFGMNVAGLPGTEWSGAFAALAVVMGVLALALLLLFRWLKWL